MTLGKEALLLAVGGCLHSPQSPIAQPLTTQHRAHTSAHFHADAEAPNAAMAIPQEHSPACFYSGTAT